LSPIEQLKEDSDIVMNLNSQDLKTILTQGNVLADDPKSIEQLKAMTFNLSAKRKENKIT